MWLYYAFTSAVGLFISVLADPLHKDATLHLAFISDVENICSQLAKHSPGASRVMKVTREKPVRNCREVKANQSGSRIQEKRATKSMFTNQSLIVVHKLVWTRILG
jgi:hypothetical protein